MLKDMVFGAFLSYNNHIDGTIESIYLIVEMVNVNIVIDMSILMGSIFMLMVISLFSFRFLNNST